MNFIMSVGEKYPEITGSRTDAFAAELNEICDTQSFTTLVLDFRGTRLINSMGMGAIFAANQKLKTQGKRLEIINVCEKVSRLLHMVSMTDLIR